MGYWHSEVFIEEEQDCTERDGEISDQVFIFELAVILYSRWHPFPGTQDPVVTLSEILDTDPFIDPLLPILSCLSYPACHILPVTDWSSDQHWFHSTPFDSPSESSTFNSITCWTGSYHKCESSDRSLSSAGKIVDQKQPHLQVSLWISTLWTKIVLPNDDYLERPCVTNFNKSINKWIE